MIGNSFPFLVFKSIIAEIFYKSILLQNNQCFDWDFYFYTYFKHLNTTAMS